MWVFWPASAAFVCSLTGCWVIIRSQRLQQFGNIAPSADRWHQNVTPGLGGIPVFAAFAGVSFWVSGLLISGQAEITHTILLAAIPLLLAGIWDDLKPVRPRYKLTVQVTAAALVLLLPLWFTGQSAFVGKTGAAIVITLTVGMLCLLWIVAIINAINLTDNMDGLSGGLSLIACVTIAAIAVRDEQSLSLYSTYSILASAILGFLVLNVKPAKLFMGDAGALWIGLAVGVGSLLAMTGGVTPLSQQTEFSDPTLWLLPPLICAVPLSDTLMVMVTRVQRGQPVSMGGRDHLSHRLVYCGFSERVSVAILWLVALLASWLALSSQALPSVVFVSLVALFVVSVGASIVWLVRATALAAQSGTAGAKTVSAGEALTVDSELRHETSPRSTA